MKNYLVFSALLILYLVFPLQVTLDRVNNAKLNNFDKIVMEDGVSRARQDGYFTPANIENLRSKIVKLCDADVDEIVINVTTVPKYKKEYFDERERINYEISVPLHNLIAGYKLLGISAKDNSKVYTLCGSVESELLEP